MNHRFGRNRHITLQLEGDTHRAIIAARHVGINLGRHNGLSQISGHQHVIDSPPDIARTRIGEVAPPCVMTIPLFEHPKGVNEPGRDKSLKPVRSSSVNPFLPRLGPGFARSSSVCATLRSPQNTTGFFSSSSLQRPGTPDPSARAQRQAAGIVFGIRRIYGDNVELLKLGRITRPSSALSRVSSSAN